MEQHSESEWLTEIQVPVDKEVSAIAFHVITFQPRDESPLPSRSGEGRRTIGAAMLHAVKVKPDVYRVGGTIGTSATSRIHRRIAVPRTTPTLSAGRAGDPLSILSANRLPANLSSVTARWSIRPVSYVIVNHVEQDHPRGSAISGLPACENLRQVLT